MVATTKWWIHKKSYFQLIPILGINWKGLTIVECMHYDNRSGVLFFSYIMWQSLPSHLTPCAVKPQRKFAHSSHQFSPLNVCTLKVCALEYLISRGLSSEEGVRSTGGFLGALKSMRGLLSITAGAGIGLFADLKAWIKKHCNQIHDLI